MGVANASPYAADVYSLGVVFWEIATRRVPWQGKNITEIISAVGFRQERPGVPQDSAIHEIEQAIASCWKQAPEERMTVRHGRRARDARGGGARGEGEGAEILRWEGGK